MIDSTIKQILVLTLLILVKTTYGAVPPSNLKCLDLRSWIKQNTYDGKHIILGYSEARKKMYGYIDNKNDTIECVYSGFKVINPYGNEITFPSPINTEHTIPQSFFNSADPMYSDIFHLYPSFQDWNSERSNNKLEEIPDQLATKWMYLNTSRSTIPPTNIAAYSESTGQLYEPRESHKGDAARSIFYFYTMYPESGTAITNLSSVQTLLQWNIQDPPDAKEIERNSKIELYQGNVNIYITQPELVDRAWGSGCTNSVDNNLITDNDLLKIYPNPTIDHLYLDLPKKFESDVIKISIHDIKGTEIYKNAGPIDLFEKMSINTSELPDGIYQVSIFTKTNSFNKTFIKKRN